MLVETVLAPSCWWCPIGTACRRLLALTSVVVSLVVYCNFSFVACPAGFEARGLHVWGYGSVNLFEGVYRWEECVRSQRVFGAAARFVRMVWRALRLRALIDQAGSKHF